MHTQTFIPNVKKHRLPSLEPLQSSYIWTVPNIGSFNELLISWNAERPVNGHYLILTSVCIQNQWSPWLLYALWGTQVQYSFYDCPSIAPVHSFQDQVEILDAKSASGFRIRIEACKGATLEKFYTIFACTTLMKSCQAEAFPPKDSTALLALPPISQFSLQHPRANCFCSPSSTMSAIYYLAALSKLPTKWHSSVLKFAENVYDAGFDIYGNWAFNVAQAFVELGSQWQCFCARSTDFKTIYHYLKLGLPVVVSVKGTLTGSNVPYKNGHLIALKGFDAKTKRILCMDPAFLSDEETSTTYCWAEFMQAWERKGFLTYFFLPQ